MFTCVSQSLLPLLPFARRALSTAARHTDVAIVGAGHNGLVAALLLARQGLKVAGSDADRVSDTGDTCVFYNSYCALHISQVEVFEDKDIVGGACRTEYPFPKVPGLGHSTGNVHAAEVRMHSCISCAHLCTM